MPWKVRSISGWSFAAKLTSHIVAAGRAESNEQIVVGQEHVVAFVQVRHFHGLVAAQPPRSTNGAGPSAALTL